MENEPKNIKIENTSEGTSTSDRSRSKTKFFTKVKVCFFIVGLLLGGVIASAAFLIYTNVTGSNSANTSQENMGPGMKGGTPPEMPDGSTPPDMSDGGTPPEMPDGSTPPDMSDGSSESTSQSTDSQSSDTGHQRSTKKSSSSDSSN